jgi:hypothetical protein
MSDFRNTLTNEKGYFLIVSTIMLLALLTIISVAATNTANTEVQIAGNDTIYQRNLYLAEGAAMEAVDRLENEASPRSLSFVAPGVKSVSDSTYQSHWDAAQPAAIDGSGETRFVAGYEGTPPGYSLGIGKSRVHGFAVYGRTQRQGRTTIKLGYRKAF